MPDGDTEPSPHPVETLSHPCAQGGHRTVPNGDIELSSSPAEGWTEPCAHGGIDLSLYLMVA